MNTEEKYELLENEEEEIGIFEKVKEFFAKIGIFKDVIKVK